eukprot:CAMPEP_0184707276 /NCGR_PEP_ID=MMETSP0313-20130426/37188_1 /TAXON_ID=2792 /ORGANISM="Porphyridium aerugineum, Strain SAG 1380-2" /LENGTH=301 /DNA_ID=CAMNT_0027168851 /DNA_START=117 /DNA_END=1022 /DNA_ORIENTATION=-
MDIKSLLGQDPSDIGAKVLQSLTTLLQQPYSYPSLKSSVLGIPVFPYLLIPHCIIAVIFAHDAHGGKDHYLKSFIMSYLTAFGGSHLTNLITGRMVPMLSGMGDTMLVTLFVVWFAYRNALWMRKLVKVRLIYAVLFCLATLTRFINVMNATTSLKSAFPASQSGPIILGGLFGTGGGLLLDLDKVATGVASLSSLSNPGWGFVTPYVAAFLVVYIPDLANSGAAFDYGFFGIKTDDVLFVLAFGFSLHALFYEITKFSLTQWLASVSSRSSTKPKVEEKKLSAAEYVAKNSPAAQKKKKT